MAVYVLIANYSPVKPGLNIGCKLGVRIDIRV
jgi:hypothetical protein